MFRFFALLCLAALAAPQAPAAEELRAQIPTTYSKIQFPFAVKLDNQTYKLFNEARKDCYRDGGYLSNVDSADEAAVMYNMMKEKYIKFAWLGVHNFYAENEWTTIQGISLNETGWAQWSSNNVSSDPSSSHCVVLEKDNGMRIADCNADYFPFICKMRF